MGNFGSENVIADAVSRDFVRSCVAHRLVSEPSSPLLARVSRKVRLDRFSCWDGARHRLLCGREESRAPPEVSTEPEGGRVKAPEEQVGTCFSVEKPCICV